MKRLLVLSALGSAVMAATDPYPALLSSFVITRHGDRTSKVAGNGTTPSEGLSYLTTLGQQEAFDQGQFFAQRYINANGTGIIGMRSSYEENSGQIVALASNDVVLGITATAFMQGLYPPDGSISSSTIGNGSSIQSPLEGYQYVSIGTFAADSPQSIWTQGSNNCPACTKASNAYYLSEDFKTTNTSTLQFYQGFHNVTSTVFNMSDMNFKNGYLIFDYINVEQIHQNPNIVTSDELFQLRTRGDQHEFNMNWNASNSDIAIGGASLLGGIYNGLNQSVHDTKKKVKLNYFASAYNVMFQLWGLTGLVDQSVDFAGLPNYAAAMAFELRAPSATSNSSEYIVRFFLRNGTSQGTPLNEFPLFNTTDIPWAEFEKNVLNKAITNVGDWCNASNSSITFCTGYKSNKDSAVSASNNNNNNNNNSSSGVSKVGAGFIGFGVTTGVYLLVGGLVYVLIRRRRNAKVPNSPGKAMSQSS